MNKIIPLKTQDDLDKTSRIIKFFDLSLPTHRCIIELHEETRSIRQNRYYWGPLLQAMEKHLGTSKDELHHDHKYRFLVPIYIRDDPEYAEMVESVKRVRKYSPGDADQLREWIIKMTSTTTASVKQFTEFLDGVKKLAISLQIRLPSEL